MKKFIIKHITHPEKYNYFFYRWLVSIFYPDKQSVKLIGVFLWLYHQNSRMIEFTDMFMIDNTIYIYTQRPSFWIGKGGCTMDSLYDYLNKDKDGKKIHDYHIQIIEDLQSANRYKNITFTTMSENY